MFYAFIIFELNLREVFWPRIKVLLYSKDFWCFTFEIIYKWHRKKFRFSDTPRLRWHFGWDFLALTSFGYPQKPFSFSLVSSLFLTIPVQTFVWFGHIFDEFHSLMNENFLGCEARRTAFEQKLLFVCDSWKSPCGPR